MASSSMRSLGTREAASLQIANLRSRVARPARTSAESSALISATRGFLQGLSRQCDLSRPARRAHWPKRLAIQFQLQRSRVLRGYLELILGREDAHFSRTYIPLKYPLRIRSHRQPRFLFCCDF